jgi:hypothetical protein
MRLRSKRGDPEPPTWAATWTATVTVVTAPDRLFGSRPWGKQALASLTTLPLAGHARIAAALRFHAAAQIARCERS